MSSVYRLSAEMVIHADQAIFSLRGVQGILDRLINTGGAVGATFSGVSRNLAKVAASAVVAKKMLNHYLDGIQAAREEARDMVDLRIAVKWTGDTPEVIEERVRRLGGLGEQVGIDYAIDPGEIKRAMAQTIDPLIGDQAMSGLTRYGALFAKNTGIGLETGIRAIKSQLQLFNMPFTEGNAAAMGNMLWRTSRLSGGEGGVDEYLSNLRRGSTAAKIAGSTPEDAALLLAALSRTKPERSGMAMASFYEALNPTEPKKRYKMKRYGLGGMFDRQGNLAGIEQIDAAFDTFFKKFPKTADRNKRLAEIFANSADALIEVFNTYDFKKLKAARDRVTDLPGAQEEREKTLDEQIEKSKKLRAGIKKKLYAPAEEWSAGLMHSLNTSLQGAFDLSKNPKLEKAWSAGIPVGIVGAGLAAAIFGGKAWKGIVGGVRGMGGLGGMLGKLGMAKALEKAAGVQPVFVVNANEMGRGAGGEIGRIIENQSGARWVDLAGGSNAPLPLPTPAMPRGLWGTGGYAPWVPSAIGTATILSVGALAIYGVQRYVEEAQVAEETAEHQEEHTRELLKKRPKLERGVIRNVEHEGKKFHWTQDRIEFEIGTRLDELRHPPQRGAPPRMRPTFTPDSPTKFDPNVFNIPNGTPNPYFSQTTMVMPPRENIVRDDETVRALGRAALDLSAAAKELKKNAHDRNLDHRGH